MDSVPVHAEHGGTTRKRWRGRVLVRLGVVRPADVAGSRVLWDSVSLSEPEGLCGNCTVDDGETCDDGNQRLGDGCSPTCRLETCGDGAIDGAEDVRRRQHGVRARRRARRAAAIHPRVTRVPRASCAAEVDACLGLTGVAEAGRRAGHAAERSLRRAPSLRLRNGLPPCDAHDRRASTEVVPRELLLRNVRRAAASTRRGAPTEAAARKSRLRSKPRIRRAARAA